MRDTTTRPITFPAIAPRQRFNTETGIRIHTVRVASGINEYEVGVPNADSGYDVRTWTTFAAARRDAIAKVEAMRQTIAAAHAKALADNTARDSAARILAAMNRH